MVSPWPVVATQTQPVTVILTTAQVAFQTVWAFTHQLHSSHQTSHLPSSWILLCSVILTRIHRYTKGLSHPSGHPHCIHHQIVHLRISVWTLHCHLYKTRSAQIAAASVVTAVHLVVTVAAMEAVAVGPHQVQVLEGEEEWLEIRALTWFLQHY